MKIELNWPDNITETQFDIPFLQGMLDRMATSYFKYGNMRAANQINGYDGIETLLARLDAYADTGNSEFLMDVSNFAMIEFVSPTQPDTYFKSTEGDESPGIAIHGQMTHDVERTPDPD